MGTEVSTPHKHEISTEELEERKLRSIRVMDSTIRSRIRLGVQYNMRMIIRGSIGSGKSTLWNRLQGKSFIAQYTPTPQIQIATIDWSFKNFEDAVKVEVWDIVDDGFETVNGGIGGNSRGGDWDGESLSILDASQMDVYKGTHGVLITINPFSKTSLDYARIEAARVPANVAVLFLLNFRDCVSVLQHGQYYGLTDGPRGDAGNVTGTESATTRDVEVSLADVHELACITRTGRGESSGGEGASTVFVIETSLLNCWGLVELNKFFDVPFLLLKKRTLEERLEAARSDLTIASHKLLTTTAVSAPEILMNNYLMYNQKYALKSGKISTVSSPPAVFAESMPSRSSIAVVSGISGQLSEESIGENFTFRLPQPELLRHKELKLMSEQQDELAGRQITRNAKSKVITSTTGGSNTGKDHAAFPSILDIATAMQLERRSGMPYDSLEGAEAPSLILQYAASASPLPAHSLVADYHDTSDSGSYGTGAAAAPGLENIMDKKSSKGEQHLLSEFSPGASFRGLNDDILETFLGGSGAVDSYGTRLHPPGNDGSSTSNMRIKNDDLSDGCPPEVSTPRVRLVSKKKKQPKT